MLSQVNTIVSVSGGSMLTAQIAGRQLAERAGSVGTADRRLRRGHREADARLASRDIHAHSILEILKPWNWFKHNVQIDDIVAEFAKGPTREKLVDLPPRPRFIVCTTNLAFREHWTFDTGTGSRGGSMSGHGPLGDLTIARACGASTCFPYAFGPMRTSAQLTTRGEYDGPDRDALIAKTDLSDGGD